MKLFTEKERVDLDPAHHNENTFNYYERSARKEISNIRQLLEDWFSKYPAHEQNELKSRFKKTFSSAFYELFIYQLFISQGFEIEIHPEIPNSTKHPDFLLKKGKIEFYLEAKEARDKSEAEEALEKRLNRVYDSLNKVKSPNFLLKVDELLLKSAKQPSIKKAIEKIETEAARIDPDELTKELTTFGLDHRAQIIHEDNDFKLTVSLISKIPSARNLEHGRPNWNVSFRTILGRFRRFNKRLFY